MRLLTIEKLRQLLMLVIYSSGIYFSVTLIKNSITKYFSYESIFTQREDAKVVTFPKITICSYQMHSKWKIDRYYPHVNETILKALYGYQEKTLNLAKSEWKQFENIDLDEFLSKTHTDIKIEHCLFDGMNCEHMWKTRKTRIGRCLQFDLNHEVENGHFVHLSRIDLESSDHNLGFVASLNKSDTTYGWHGNMRGLHLYYNYFTDSVEEENKALTISSQLTPIVSFKLSKNSYLGAPYTKCEKSHIADRYSIFNASDIYKKASCEMKLLIDRIIELCECQPNYLHNFRKEDFDQGKPYCSFYDNVKCVAPVMDRKGLTKTDDCAPACHSYEFNQDKIQYRVPPKSDDASKYFMTAVLRTTEERLTIVEERLEYTINELFADIGGSLGLILGLSAVKILNMICRVVLRTKKFYMDQHAKRCKKSVHRRVLDCKYKFKNRKGFMMIWGYSKHSNSSPTRKCCVLLRIENNC